MDIKTYFDHELPDVNIGIILSSKKNGYKCIYKDLLFVENFTLNIKECVFIFISVRHLDNSEILPIPFDHKYDILNIYCMILKSGDVVHAVDCLLY